MLSFIWLCECTWWSWCMCVCVFQGSCKRRCVCSTSFPWREDHWFRHSGNKWTDPQAPSPSMYTHQTLTSFFIHKCISLCNSLFSHQPVHNMGSSGYGSHGSNGSHEQLVSISSSSESNGIVTPGNTLEETGKAKPARTFQEICKGVHMLKNQDSQVSLRSPPSSPSPSPSPSRPEQKKTMDSEFNLI